jgi:hypothetical protein
MLVRVIPGAHRAHHPHVVQHFDEELKRLVPTP